MFALHDRIVARHLRHHVNDVDVVHLWPSGALETLRVAREVGIRTVLERPNAHTRVAYQLVREECERIGVSSSPATRTRVEDRRARKGGGRVRASRFPALPVGFLRTEHHQ